MDINCESMDIKIAFQILDIDVENIKYENINLEFLKKKYHRLALKNHPDKNGNTIESNQKFQKINEAYKYLINEFKFLNDGYDDDAGSSFNHGFAFDFDFDFVSSSNFDTSKNVYISLLSIFISSIIKCDSELIKSVITKIIKEIVINYNDLTTITLQKMFDDLSKDNTIEIYSFLYKNKDILYISNETLELVSLVIKEKYKNDRVFILNPSIKDIFDNNIYKLYVDEELYLVPLWHSELYFDNDIIVICNPELPDKLTIDEDNNIYYELLIPFTKENLLVSNDFQFEICGNIFKIPIHKLTIQREQIYVLKNQGISKIIDDNIYNINTKSDIIVKIIFC